MDDIDQTTILQLGNEARTPARKKWFRYGQWPVGIRSVQLHTHADAKFKYKKREAPSCSLIERLVVCPDFQKLLEKDRAIGMPTRSLSNYSSCSDPFVLCHVAAFPNGHTFHLAKSPITHHRLYIGDEECMPWAIAQAMKERWGAVTFPKPERPIRKWLCELAHGHAREVRMGGRVQIRTRGRRIRDCENRPSSIAIERVVLLFL